MSIRLRLAGLAALIALGGVGAAYAQDEATKAACAGGDGAACLSLGEAAYLGTDGAPADVGRALDLFAQACALGNAPACYRLGAELEFPDFGAPDAEGALTAYTEACGLGLEEGCARAGIEAPHEEPAQVKTAAAETVTDAENEDGPPAPDDPAAEDGAERGVPVIVTASVAPEAETAEPFSGFDSEALPDLEFGETVIAAAEPAEGEEGAEVPPAETVEAEPGEPDEETLLAIERREMGNACGGGTPDACETYAAWLRDGTGGPADIVRARRIFSVICTEGSVKGCYELAWMMYDASQSELELSRARFLFSETCQAGITEACLQAADMRLSGEGGRADTAGAARFLGVACEGGLEMACEAATDLAALDAGPGEDDEDTEILPASFEDEAPADAQTGEDAETSPPAAE